MAVASGTIDTTYLVLSGAGWPPGKPQFQSAPTDGFDGSTAFNVSAAGGSEYQGRVGEVVVIYDTTNKGYAGLIYLQHDTADVTMAAGLLCCPAGSSTNTSKLWYKVNDDASNRMLGSGRSPACVALGAMTTDYYGYFWYAGVAPETDITGLATTVKTYLDTSAINVSAGDDDNAADNHLIAATTGNIVVGFVTTGATQ